jgi:hypothetical protein
MPTLLCVSAPVLRSAAQWRVELRRAALLPPSRLADATWIALVAGSAVRVEPLSGTTAAGAASARRHALWSALVRGLRIDAPPSRRRDGRARGAVRSLADAVLGALAADALRAALTPGSSAVAVLLDEPLELDLWPCGRRSCASRSAHAPTPPCGASRTPALATSTASWRPADGRPPARAVPADRDGPQGRAPGAASR